MKTIKSTVLLLLLLGLMTATAAQAAGGHGRFHGGGGFHGGHIGVVVDPWPLLYPFAYFPLGGYPYGYYPYGYYPPVAVAQPAAPTVYVEQATEQAAPAQGVAAQQSGPVAAPSNNWYYCRKPEGYYPYVRSCPNGWQSVPAQPPTQH